jgi:hypothetical protein
VREKLLAEKYGRGKCVEVRGFSSGWREGNNVTM